MNQEHVEAIDFPLVGIEPAQFAGDANDASKLSLPAETTTTALFASALLMAFITNSKTPTPRTSPR